MAFCFIRICFLATIPIRKDSQSSKQSGKSASFQLFLISSKLKRADENYSGRIKNSIASKNILQSEEGRAIFFSIFAKALRSKTISYHKLQGSSAFKVVDSDCKYNRSGSNKKKLTQYLNHFFELSGKNDPV